MPNYQILESVPNPEDGTDIEKDAPRFFTNIDTEDFEFTWDGKPFGGIFPDRMKSRQENITQRVLNDKGFAESVVGAKIVYDFVKPLVAGETVTMPKYLVNYAAAHLARKIYKREAFAAFKGTEEEKKHAAIRFVNPEEEIKLMKKMVAKNFPDQIVEEPKMPTAQTVIDKTQVDKTKDGVKCDQCDFVAKTELGLKAHRRKHK